MDIQFVQDLSNHSKGYVAYKIKTNLGFEIGTIEGAGNTKGEFTCIIKITNLDYQRKGIGLKAFEKVFDEINLIYPISIIKGTWHKNKQFAQFKGSMSTNLLLFTQHSQTKNPTQSAMLTSTGKWAAKLGYNNCKIITNTPNLVEVDFTK